MGARPPIPWTTFAVVLMMCVTGWLSLVTNGPPAEARLTEQPSFQTVMTETNFTSQGGFTLSNLTYQTATGLTTLNRPTVSWTATTGNGLTTLRTGACSAYLPATDQVFLIGGRIDVNPTQTGDEAMTKTVDVFDVTNNSWEPSPEEMKQEQQYHGCAVVGQKIYAIGDHYPFASPSQQATGVVQVYDASAGNWSYGTSMPGNRSVGLAGVTSLNGMVYVAGGVSAHDRSDSNDRLMRYDPVNDVWSQLSSMNNRRHSFELVAFKGKLIAYGGVTTYFDPVLNTTVEGESNLTEAYDPITNTWSQLPNATHALSAYAADVFNDEIIIHGGYELTGWQGTGNDKTYGYDPFTNRWTTYATLQVGLWDSTLTRANNTLVYAGGDASWSRFNTWSIQYLAETEYHVNPAQQTGMLTSPIKDLRTHSDGAASFLWLSFSTVEPTGSSIGLQYRTAQSPQALATTSWKPTSVPVNTYLSAGNASLTAAIEDAPYIQYRVKYSTDEVMNWITPTLVNITVGADTAAFVSSLPASMQPTSSAITVTTQHHGPTQEGTYTLQLHPSDAFGTLSSSASWMQLIWNTTTSSLTVVDDDGLLFGQPSATVGAMTADGQTVDWSFSLSGTMPSGFLRAKTTTHAQRNVTYLHPDVIAIDRNVTVSIINVTADASSVGDLTVENQEVLPGNAELNVTLDHYFTNSGLRLLGGQLQARLHLDLETYDVDAFGTRIWSNETSAWFDLPSGQVYHALLNLPEAVSGDARLWFEARTAEDWELVFSTEPHLMRVNSNGPVLQSVSPPLGAYINEDTEQTASFVFHDVGGFTSETLSAHVWFEGVNDGTNGQALDGIAQRQEYTPIPFTVHASENTWLVNVTVNDTANDDHEWTRVLLEGTDIAGFGVPTASPETGHARWESRTPSKSQLVLFEPTKNLLNDNTMRFEPSQEVGWSMVIEDPNGLSDVQEVRLELGNDDNLGIKYTLVDNTCASLDERLQVLPIGCQVDTSNGQLSLDITADVQWSLTSSGLITGEIDVFVKDRDGTQHYDFSEAWVLERSMTIDITSLEDEDGVVQQSINQASVVMAGDHLNLSATVLHLTSGTPYNGELRLRWDGSIQSDDWRGGFPVTIVNGQLSASIPTPETSGLVHDLAITLWDPLQTEILASYDVTSFGLDHLPPALLPSSISDTISRYHLDNVQVGVNIDEEQTWSSPLTLTCQIRSLAVNWEPITLVRNATTVFNGNTMFSFTYDFSQLGDPSTLSPQATLACWAEGRDDAGFALVSDTGNSELNPWLEAPLNNIGPDLALENVEYTQDVKAGEKVTLSFFVVNGGESLDTPFNASIEILQGDERTLVGRSIFSAMDENTAKSVRRSFTAPEGEWTLQITVDLEQQIWEIDETNNAFTATFTTNAGGLSWVVLASSGGVLALLAAALLKRRSALSVDQEAIKNALVETGEATRAPVAEPPKKRGPPGGKIASTTSSSPAKSPPNSPPRGPPKTTGPVVDESPQAMAAKYLDALGAPAEPSTPSTHAVDYTQLPGGGEYEYTAEGTFYVGETCGRWQLNEDKSFTRLPDEP